MRHIVMTAAALAVLGAPGVIASAQGQGPEQGQEQGQGGDRETNLERAGGTAKQNREAQYSRAESDGTDKTVPSRHSDEAADKRKDAAKGPDRAAENASSNAMRGMGPNAAGKGNAATGRADGRTLPRDLPAQKTDDRSREPDAMNGNRPRSDGRNAAQGNLRRAEASDQPISRRIVGDSAQFQFVQSDYLIRGCPPGLARKGNGCLPPGQEKQQRLLGYGADYFGYRNLEDGRYRYGNGYLYRFSDSGGLLGYIPLLGGALSIGRIWPRSYQRNQVPDYFAEYYNLGPPRNYGYADDVIYRLDPQSSAITSIAALLTGDEFNVGEVAPGGYDIYNVPSAYRERYRDTPDADYRYSDGYIYEIDPATRIVRAAIELLA